MLHVGVRCAMSVHCTLVVTCWEKANLLSDVFVVNVVFYHFSKCVLVHIRINASRLTACPDLGECWLSEVNKGFLG